MIIGKQVVKQFGLTENFASWHVLIFAVLNVHVLLGIFIALCELFIH